MATPRFVPVAPRARARHNPIATIPPRRWSLPNSRDLLREPRARGLSVPCPDGGYALLLVREVVDDLVLAPGEQRDDALAAIATVAMRRAGVARRAPVIHDVRFACALLRYDDPDARGCAVVRAKLLSGVARDAVCRQRLADAVHSAAEVSVRSTAAALAMWPCHVVGDRRNGGDPAAPGPRS